MHASRGVNRREAKRELTEAQLDVDRCALLRRPERLSKPEKVAVKTNRDIDILDVEVDLGIAEHNARL